MIHKCRREDTHKPCQYQEIWGKFIDLLLQCCVKCFPLGKFLTDNNCSGDTFTLCVSYSTGICFVTDDGGNLSWPFLGNTSLDDCLHIATTARNEDNNLFHGGIVPLSGMKPQIKMAEFAK